MKKTTTALGLVMALALTGCGGSGDSPTAKDTSGSNDASAAKAGEVAQTGDAATNPACALLDTSTVEAATGATIAEINGNVNPGQFAQDSHNCYWISTDPNGGPWAVAVQLEDGLGSALTTATSAVQAGTELGGTAVPGLGDVAVAGSSGVRIVFGDRYLMVQVTKGADDPDGSASTEKAVDLARGILGASGDSAGSDTDASASPAAASPPLTGDAATNPVCKAVSVDEIVQQVAATPLEVKGLTSPGSFGKTVPSCTWYLESTEIQASIAVQWEHPIGQNHDPVVGGYQDTVRAGLATRVRGVGDYAIYQNTTAEAVSGPDIVRVSVLMHAEPTRVDRDNAIALLKLILARVSS